MKGEVLIEVCDNNDNIKYTVSKKNKIVDYYKKYPFVVQHLKDGTGNGYGLYICIPNDNWDFPLVDTEGNFSFNQEADICYRSWDSQTVFYDVSAKQSVLESDSWNSLGKRELDFVSNGYFQGPVTIKGIITASVFVPESFSLGVNSFWNHIFSALDIDPYIEVEENERAYIHYKLIMEW